MKHLTMTHSLLHIYPVLNVVQSCFISVAAGFVGQYEQGRRGQCPCFLCSVSRAEGTGKQRSVWEGQGKNLAFSKVRENL